MTKKVISTEAAPKAIGPYSQAIVSGGVAYLSGQIPLDPKTGQIVEGDIVQQTERVFANIQGVLEAAGASFDSVLKTTVFLLDMADFTRMNEIYARYFPKDPPARSTVQAARLPRDVRIEIECIATATH
jgi:2-iminobutanoate/2-iminopropanoate deaminase